MSDPVSNQGIVWIASYPKCGNTWVRFLLYAALHGVPKQSVDVAKRIPDIHRKLPVGADPVRLVKTHLALNDRHPDLARTGGAIHIIRNPRDVLLSALNYRRLSGVEEATLPSVRYAEVFMRSGGDPDWIQQGFGTWGQHARSWRDQDRFPVLPVRYEDLKADPVTELERMLAFLGEARSGEQVAAAVKAASFDAMRALEIREKNDRSKKSLEKRLFIGDDKASRSGRFFMSTGATGQSLESIAPGLDSAFDAAFSDDLAEYGYQTDA